MLKRSHGKTYTPNPKRKSVGSRDIGKTKLKDGYLALVLRHARLLDETGSLAEALTYYRQAVDLSGNDPHHLRHLGLALARARVFEEATEILASLVDTFPADRELHTWLGTLYQNAGQSEKSRRVIWSHFSQYPSHVKTSKHRSAPTLLRIFGAENTIYRIGFYGGDRAKKKRLGGHFATRFLLNSKPYHTNSYYIVQDNINRIAPEEPYGLLLNTIADPDVELASLKSLETYIAAHPGIRVINHPSKVIPTSRDENYKTFRDMDGFHFPRTERLISEGRASEAIADDMEARGFIYPFIVREPGTHTARSTALVENRKALVDHLSGVRCKSYYIIEFVENASAERHYSKIRFFAIDGILYPVVYHIDQVWNVHGGNRKTFMSSHDWMLERERQFLKDPASVIGSDVYDRLKTLPEVIGLEFFGVDCTIMSDGTVLIFELNPAMRHSFDHARKFEYLHPYMQAITDAFTKMVDDRIRGAA